MGLGHDTTGLGLLCGCLIRTPTNQLHANLWIDTEFAAHLGLEVSCEGAQLTLIITDFTVYQLRRRTQSQLVLSL